MNYSFKFMSNIFFVSFFFHLISFCLFLLVSQPLTHRLESVGFSPHKSKFFLLSIFSIVLSLSKTIHRLYHNITRISFCFLFFLNSIIFRVMFSFAPAQFNVSILNGPTQQPTLSSCFFSLTFLIFHFSTTRMLNFYNSGSLFDQFDYSFAYTTLTDIHRCFKVLFAY